MPVQIRLCIENLAANLARIRDIKVRIHMIHQPVPLLKLFITANQVADRVVLVPVMRPSMRETLQRMLANVTKHVGDLLDFRVIFGIDFDWNRPT